MKKPLHLWLTTSAYRLDLENVRTVKRGMSYREFSDDRIPLAYFITFRAYGTWLHGRAGSVDRLHNRYRTPKLIADAKRLEYSRSLMKADPVKLTTAQRDVVLAAIKETCEIKKWSLWAVNIRSNHVHSVVTAMIKPRRIMNAFKAHATRKLKEAGLWRGDTSPWARRGSRKYLWDEKSVQGAIAYVLYEQGD